MTRGPDLIALRRLGKWDLRPYLRVGDHGQNLRKVRPLGDGVTRDISIDGAFLYYNHPDTQALPLRADERVNVVFNIPGHDPIRASPRVAWSDILALEEASTVVGVGLQFLDVSPEDREFLLTAITEKIYQAKGDGVRKE